MQLRIFICNRGLFMRFVRSAGVRRALMTSSVLGGLLVSGAAFAQAGSDITTVSPTPSQTSADDRKSGQNGTDDIIVTGSHIRQSNYNTASPVEIITHEDLTLAGSRSTTEVLQGSSVTSGGAQVNNTFLGFVTSGGPGSNTVGLRGLGPDRTLVLLNGRRLSPAGTESEVGAADLNVLPTAMVDHIEVLKDGASSVYGSDAVAGVINIITPTKVDGLTIDTYGNLPIHQGGGDTFRVSGVYGKTFDRGRFAISAEYSDTNRLQYKDRGYARCPTDGLVDPTTGKPTGADVNLDGSDRCFPFSYSGGQGIAQDYFVAYNLNGSVHRFTPNAGQVAGGGNLDGYTRVDQVALRPPFNTDQLNDDIYSPVKKLTLYSNGEYDLGSSHDLELYGEVLFSRRLSNQTDTRQLSADLKNVLPGYYPGYYNYQLFPTALANAGYFLANPLFILGNTQSSQRVNYLRADGGIRGDVGIKNWKFDANAMYARNWSRYTTENTLTSHIAQSFDLVAAPAGMPDGLTVTAGPDRVLPGRYTCAANIGVSNPQCVPIDVFSPSLLAGNVPANLRSWLLTPVTGHTSYEQITGEVNVSGDLITLPAGALGFSLGASVRHDKLNDVPSIHAQQADLYQYSSASITKGTDLVTEVYGELSIPLLKNKPFFEDLSASVSGRYTHYRSYGSDTTYKVGGNWSPFDFIRFRGSYGTSFRAPNLYEQNVADQTGFFGPTLDPCNDYADNYPTSSNRYKNCASIFGGQNFIASGGPQSISQGGHGQLKAEKSTSLTYGLVLQPKFIDLSFAVDYYRIVVKNEVQQLGTDILNFCYDSTDFPNNYYCQFISPRDPNSGNLTVFRDPFINVAQQSTDGIDFTTRYSHVLGQGVFTANATATRVLSQKYKESAFTDTFDYSGSLGNQGFAGGPKWTGNLDLQYKIGGFTFRYGLDYVGPMNGYAAFGVTDPSTDPEDLKTGKYFTHTLAVQYQAQNGILATLGVSNFTDAKPEKVSVATNGQISRIGNYFNYSGYDFLGRSLFLEVSKKF